jgi:hypothetical protein
MDSDPYEIAGGFGVKDVGQAVGSDPFAAWCEELALHDPRSYEYQQLAAVIIELADSTGRPVDLSPEALGRVDSAEAAPPVPPAFVGATALSEVRVPAEQFTLIPPLQGDGVYVVDGTTLTSDIGKIVRVIDLRPQLADSLNDIAPDAAESRRLDSHFYHDLRQFVEKGWARNSVHRGGRSSGPLYSKYMGSRARTFWSPVRVVEESGAHVLTVARLADNGNGADKEVTLYRRIFGLTARNIK